MQRPTCIFDNGQFHFSVTFNGLNKHKLITRDYRAYLVLIRRKSGVLTEIEFILLQNGKMEGGMKLKFVQFAPLHVENCCFRDLATGQHYPPRRPPPPSQLTSACLSERSRRKASSGRRS